MQLMADEGPGTGSRLLSRARGEGETAESLTRSTQPGLVSPGGSEQAQWYHPVSLSSESGESLRHMDATVKQTRK